jgi:hypothetical protein
MYKEWSKNEEKLLLYELENNIDYSIIQTYHNRSIEDIKSKILDIAEQMINKNISIFTIYKKTRIKYEILLNLYNKNKNKNKSFIQMIKSISNDVKLIKDKLDIA